MKIVRETVSIKMTPDIWNRFKSCCALQGQEMSSTLEKIIEKYLKQEKVKKNDKKDDEMEKRG